MPKSYEEIKARKAVDPEYAERLRKYARDYVSRNVDKEKERARLSMLTFRQNNREAYNQYAREYRAKNKERINARSREKRIANPELYRKQGRDRYAKDPYAHRNVRLKSTYGITLAEYNAKYDSQNGKCAICGCDKKCGGHDGLVVDHCHNSKKVRDLLCSQCNQGIGKFRESEEILQKAIDYIRKFNL